ncbi:antibiotic resistance ATP-binding protein [Streptomyces himastatinicus ATCC 53653]|uniref:Antibiotic resistance ATP-binding protein n=2 Tax=Streptomyces violaceusniger group TaxID=2839105 RepID=D9WMN9_9ACTN|nr:antibiotic resistance ATP-binding protein [Streptomyces himastatinicus ATCC 53653]
MRHDGIMDFTPHADYLRHEPVAIADITGKAPGGSTPAGHIRLRFADAHSLEAAMTAFGPVTRDDEALAVYIPTDGGIPALRAVLDTLDSASIEAEALTVHTPDLDDIALALTGPMRAASEVGHQ